MERFKESKKDNPAVTLLKYMRCKKLFVLAKLQTLFDKVPEGLHIDEAAGKATFKCHCDCYKCNFCYNRKEENGEHPDIRTDVWVLKH